MKKLLAVSVLLAFTFPLFGGSWELGVAGRNRSGGCAISDNFNDNDNTGTWVERGAGATGFSESGGILNSSTGGPDVAVWENDCQPTIDGEWGCFQTKNKTDGEWNYVALRHQGGSGSFHALGFRAISGSNNDVAIWWKMSYDGATQQAICNTTAGLFREVADDGYVCGMLTGTTDDVQGKLWFWDTGPPPADPGDWDGDADDTHNFGGSGDNANNCNWASSAGYVGLGNYGSSSAQDFDNFTAGE